MTHFISIAGFRVPQVRSSAGGAGRGQGAARPLVRRAPGRGRVPVCCHVQQPLPALIGLVGRGGVRRAWERAGRAPKGHVRSAPSGAGAGGELKRESCDCTILIPPESHRQLDAGGRQSKPAAHRVSASFPLSLAGPLDALRQALPPCAHQQGLWLRGTLCVCLCVDQCVATSPAPSTAPFCEPQVRRAQKAITGNKGHVCGAPVMGRRLL